MVAHPKEGEIVLTDDYEALGFHYVTAIMPVQVAKPKHYRQILITAISRWPKGLSTAFPRGSSQPFETNSSSPWELSIVRSVKSWRSITTVPSLQRRAAGQNFSATKSCLYWRHCRLPRTNSLPGRRRKSSSIITYNVNLNIIREMPSQAKCKAKARYAAFSVFT